jgi:hypothetical protein
VPLSLFYISNVLSGYAFAALKADGSITAWGRSGGGGLGATEF